MGMKCAIVPEFDSCGLCTMLSGMVHLSPGDWSSEQTALQMRASSICPVRKNQFKARV